MDLGKNGVVVGDGIFDLFGGQVWQIAEAVLTGVAQEVAVRTTRLTCRRGQAVSV